MKAKLPPMFARVVVADEVADGARRELVLKSLVTLARSRVLDEVRRYIEVEQGALARQARILPASVKRAASAAMRVLGTLEQVAARAGMWGAMYEDEAVDLDVMEKGLFGTLQVLMDEVFKAQSSFDARARVLVAGLGGCDLVPLRRLWATSGLEAAVNLADEVRRAVRGVGGNPFSRFLAPQVMPSTDSHQAPVAARLEAAPKPEVAVLATRRRRRLGPQTHRPRPESPRETDPRDEAILRAIASGESGKNLAGLTGKFGVPSSESHVRKRRMDLLAWGWITGGRDPRLTPDGEKWLSEIPSKKAATAT